ncbi:MAG: hypothetical protein ACJ76B_11660 [Solirubrobacterales bacterium]
MARALGIAIALVLLAATAAPAASEPSGKLLAGSEETALRLHDLPPGYLLGDDGGCGPLGPGGEEGEPSGKLQRRYLRWLVRHRPEGCLYQYEQVFKVPGLGPAPPLVEVETVNTPSEEAAAVGFALIMDLIERYQPRADRGTVAVPPNGVEARLLHSKNFLVDGKPNRPGTVLIWQSGTLISYLQAAGMGPRRNDRAALAFASIQQGRLEHPTPYTEAEQDDTEVRLDDPGLKAPVYWVGRAFAPGAGLPAATLEEAFDVKPGRGGPAGQKWSLSYDGFTLDLWTRASWKRFARSRLGRINLEARCTASQSLPLAGGSATIFATYEGRFRKCPAREPDRYYGIARVGGMVVGVNLGLCLSCRGGTTGAYGARRGVVAVLRALSLRPKPAY